MVCFRFVFVSSCPLCKQKCSNDRPFPGLRTEGAGKKLQNYPHRVAHRKALRKLFPHNDELSTPTPRQKSFVGQTTKKCLEALSPFKGGIGVKFVSKDACLMDYAGAERVRE